VTTAGYISTDGVHWTKTLEGASSGAGVTGSYAGVIKASAFGNDKLVVIGNDYKTSLPLVTTDGINWQKGSFDQKANTNAIAYGNGIFVGVGRWYSVSTSGTAMSAISTDGLSWTTYPAGGSLTALNGIAYGDNKFVAVGLNGLIETSEDGVHWNVIQQGGPHLNDIVYSETDKRFIAVGNQGAILTSSDGAAWSSRYVSCRREYRTGQSCRSN
jgi:hypothetical protein